MTQKFKRIFFCQGDKKELEEITGQIYEYIKPEEIKSQSIQKKPTEYSKNTYQTFIEAGVRTTNRREIRRELYKVALKLGADALIHYTDSLINREMYWFGYARGTPLRIKK